MREWREDGAPDLPSVPRRRLQDYEVDLAAGEAAPLPALAVPANPLSIAADAPAAEVRRPSRSHIPQIQSSEFPTSMIAQVCAASVVPSGKIARNRATCACRRARESTREAPARGRKRSYAPQTYCDTPAGLRNHGMSQHPEEEVPARPGTATLPLLPLDRGSQSTPDSGLEPQLQVCCLGRDHSAREMYLTN